MSSYKLETCTAVLKRVCDTRSKQEFNTAERFQKNSSSENLYEIIFLGKTSLAHLSIKKSNMSTSR